MPRRLSLGFAGSRLWLWPLGVGVLCFALPPLAHASLGQRYDSVVADRARLAARMASATSAAQTVHTLTLANGGVVREYADANGVVFAVAWRAPGRPDLQQLLGGNFATLQADNLRADGRRTRRPLAVNRTALVLHSGGHPGAFWGVAYLPQAIPAGVAAKDLR